MAQQKITVDQILKLVQTLSSEERAELQRRLETSTWSEQWDQLSAKIRAQFTAAGEPIPSEEDVIAEVKALRQERKGKRVQGSN